MNYGRNVDVINHYKLSTMVAKIDSIQQMCMKKLKIKAISEKIHYSEEEKQFLIDNIGNHSYAELAVLFSKKFIISSVQIS